jgi:predicted RNase H-like HicB family nuclease
MAQFVGIIHKEKGSDYGVCFPDFPGCVTAGSTMQEAFEMAREALRGHIDTMREYGDPLPKKPMTLDMAQKHELAAGAVSYFMVDTYLPAKAKRVNVTINEDILRDIDAITDNRSAFLEAAAAEKLHRRSA